MEAKTIVEAPVKMWAKLCLCNLRIMAKPIVQNTKGGKSLNFNAYSKLPRRTLTGELDVRGASSGKPGRYAHASLALINSQQTQIYEDIRMYYGTYKQDFWERFRACLEELKHKVQRTGYRLTLVKSYSMAEPDFIEVKTVTHCGKSDGSDLTTKNMSWHEEVRGFCSALCDRVSGDYALESEHTHSNCVLIARKKICRDGVWHTWIDDERFHKLIAKYYEDGTPFTADDYTALTPYWAVYDTKGAGFRSR
ncbi:tRNA wybutosine-synthesis [Phytophthora cactorum]|nr:tRNA wybutosine-synthesis [Phytophthora cactorum]